MTASTLSSAEEAVRVVRTGDTVMVGGFGLVGAPLALIDALVDHSDATDLTIVSNNIGEPGRGLGKLLRDLADADHLPTGGERGEDRETALERLRRAHPRGATLHPAFLHSRTLS